MRHQHKSFIKYAELMIGMLMCMLLCCSCRTVNNQKVDSYTLLIYLCGSSLESKNGYASKNIEEMLAADLPENVHVVIQTGGTKEWKNESILPDVVGRYEIADHKLVLIESLPQANMGSESTLSSFLSYGKDHYPSDKMSLILWNHGGGSIKGICYDECYDNDALTLNELDRAMEQAGISFEFVGLDACLMADYDTAHRMKQYAHYMIASEEIMPASGWDYTCLLNCLNKDDFYQTVLDGFAKKQGSKSYYTLSCIDLSHMQEVDEIVTKMAEKLSENRTLLSSALSDTIEFGSNDKKRDATNQYDLERLARSLGLPFDCSSFITLVNGSSRTDATGLSIYLPIDNMDSIKEYVTISQNQAYIQFLSEYSNREPEVTIEFAHHGFDDGGHLSFAVSDQSLSYIQSVTYELFQFVNAKDDGSNLEIVYGLGNDNDISQFSSMFTVDFSGRWVFLNDEVLNCDVFEEKENYTLFSSPVKVNGAEGSLIFSYSKAAKQILIEGYIESTDIRSRIQPLEEGSEVTLLYNRQEYYNDRSFYEGKTVIWNEDCFLSVQSLPQGYYQYRAKIRDIYGNEFPSATAVIEYDGNAAKIVTITTDVN